MGTKRGGEGRRLKARRRAIAVESLEGRALLATAAEMFVGPSLSSLVALGEKGRNETSAEVSKLLDALQSQLQGGPLADLNSGAVTANGFIAEAQVLEASFEADADQQLLAKFAGTDELIKLQGQRVLANLVALDQQESVGLITSSTLATSAASTIKSLTTGPITALGTKSSAITSLTQAFDANLATLEQRLAGGSLGVSQVDATLGAEAEAYRSSIHAGLQLTQQRISGETDTSIDALESAANSATTSAQLTTAVNTFEATVLGKSGYFAARGALSKSKSSKLNQAGGIGQEVSKFTTVSATSTVGGTATLTATLTDSLGDPLMGESVAFTLDGAFAGVGLTNFKGVAIVREVPTSDVVGTDAGVIATFAGDNNFQPTTSGGNLVVARSSTAIGTVSGSLIYGGTVTLQANLGSASGLGLAGETISFSLDGTTVGTAVTNGLGVATLTGIAAANQVGTDTGGIVASFAGDANNAASAMTGNLVVTQAPTTLSAVGGTAPLGGTASLTATLDSSETGQGIPGEKVTFTLDGTSVGTAQTNSSGVATLTGVATTDAIGSTGTVLASYVGDANYKAAANSTGRLVVGQAPTTITGVSGTEVFGGPATLVATLTNSANSEGVSGATVSFQVGGTTLGTAVTNSSGIATLTGVTTTEPVDTDTGAVVASFAGSTNDAATTGTGDLLVTQAPTAITNVSASAMFGGTATLTATLKSTVTAAPLGGQTVQFTLGGTSVGSSITNSNGVATLSNVPENDEVGTIASGVTASFSGTTSYSTTTGTGRLVVSKAATAIAAISGNATFGGQASLTATLTSGVTDKGISGETLVFMLDGKMAGSAVSNSDGLASLSGVATADAVGTDKGGISVSFAGDPSFAAATAATGNLAVSKAGTTLSDVGGTATGGMATLSATLKSSVTGLGIPDETVVFTLDKKAAGSVKTNSEGVATLTGVATADAAGPDVGGVAANFAGDASYDPAAQQTGNLVVNS